MVIDYDLLAVALSGPRDDDHAHSPEVKQVTKAARSAAIIAAVQIATRTDVYLIHSNPGQERLAWYRSQRAQVITIDPGREAVVARVKRERPPLMLRAVDEWYAIHSHEGVPSPRDEATTSRAW